MTVRTSMRAVDSFSRRFSPSALRATFVSDIGIDSAVGIDKVTGEKFQSQIASETALISAQVFQGSYHFTNYRQLLMTKGPSECPRELCIPTIRDKVALKALSQVLDDIYGDRCLTPQPQPIVNSLALHLHAKRYDSFVKFDIKRFYASIEHAKLLRILRRKIRKKSLLSLIEKSISTPSVELGRSKKERRKTGVPEGLPLSNRLANIYVEDIDTAFASEEEVEYYRYVDDIIVLCTKADTDKVKQKMECLVRKLGLTLNTDKTQAGTFGTVPCEYLGYVFHANAITPRRTSVLNLERWLENHMRSWKSAQNEPYWLWKLKLRITGCRITEDGKSFSRFGWLFYFSQSTDAITPHKLDALTHKLARRYGVALPDDLPSFSKCYYEVHFRNGEGGCIPVIDFSTSAKKKARILKTLYGNDIVVGLSEEEVDNLFRRRMIKEAKNLEKDVGALS